MRILGIFTLVMLACTLLCGLWMKFGRGEKDAGFHGMLSVLTVLLSMVTIVAFLLKLPK